MRNSVIEQVSGMRLFGNSWLRATSQTFVRRDKCWTSSLRSAFSVLAVLSCLVGCAPRFQNAALKRYEPTAGYRFDTLARGDGNTDKVFVVLAFSGGGTRAAAFAYGVLQGLRDTPIGGTGESPTYRLLDEVDMISAVSGGAFTAMGYALWGDVLFDGQFQDRFLTRNIQRELLLHLLNPLNLLTLPLPLLDSIDVAAAYYDKEIFNHRTYGDLLDRGTRPFVVVNATDVARKQTFEFTQDDFDLLGSDLSSLPVSWAVAASSAFPILLTPLRLHYFPGDPMEAAITDVLVQPGGLYIPRRKRWARSLLKAGTADSTTPVTIDGDNHKYLYLLDGGLSDNLGLHAFIRAYRSGFIRRKIEAGKIEKLVVILVDAGTERPIELERSRAAPGRLVAAITSATSGIYNSSNMVSAVVHYALLEAEPQTRRAYDECSNVMAERCPQAVAPTRPPSSQVEAYVVDVNFHQIEDQTIRSRFMSMITSFVLPIEEVHALIEEGRHQITKHPEIQRLVRDLRAAANEPDPGRSAPQHSGSVSRR